MSLEISKLESWYGEVQILFDVDMEIKEGEMIALIGPNGAGKSTVLKNVFGLIEKNKGSITFEGKSITKLRPHEIVKQGISYVPQGRSIFPSLTVQENLELGAYIYDKDLKKDLNYVYDKFPRLKERKSQNAGLLSGGEQQMVALGRGLMLSPKLMLLDEPSLGLSPQMKKVIFDKIIEINKTGVTILMVEQNARMAMELCNRVYILELGKNKLEGTGKKLLKDKRVQKLYLGGG